MIMLQHTDGLIISVKLLELKLWSWLSWFYSTLWDQTDKALYRVPLCEVCVCVWCAYLRVCNIEGEFMALRAKKNWKRRLCILFFQYSLDVSYIVTVSCYSEVFDSQPNVIIVNLMKKWINLHSLFIAFIS